MKNKIYISPLQYITQKTTAKEIEAEVRAYLNGGGDWVQLRMKGATSSEFMRVAKHIRELCFAYNATFIINDNVDVALFSGADGVHLGKGDMPTSAVRPLVGKNFIIGRTANTVRDIEILSNQHINYIGLGPYRHTMTKDKLSAILGIEGYKHIFSSLREKHVLHPPVVAIGGITLADLELLASINEFHGVAISGAIANASDPMRETMSFVHDVEKYFNIKNYSLK